MNDIIPVSEPLLDGNEAAYVLDCIRSGWVSSEGPYVRDFEAACAAYCGMPEGIAVCNGTAALQIALRCLPLEKGDEVIMPAFTIISCAIAVIEAGAVPVLVDCDPETWTMNVDEIREKITPRTRALMAVHIYGHPVDMDPIRQIAEEHDLWVIEDAAEAHGAEYKGKKCGGLADISILSFYANKLVTTGEGGMVLTGRRQFADRARRLRNMCFEPHRRFYHTEIGHNYRMSNLQSALGLAQLERIACFVARKREMARQYTLGLQGLPLELPSERPWAKNIYWMYAVVLKDAVDTPAAAVSEALMNKGIQTRPFFTGMHEQPALQAMGLFAGQRCPVTERISRKGFYLPSGQAITDGQITRVIDAVRQTLDALR